MCERKTLWPAGDIDYRHAFLDMSSITVSASNHTRAGATCRAAMGFSFAAGTTDGEWLTDMRLAEHVLAGFTQEAHTGLSPCLSCLAPATRLQG